MELSIIIVNYKSDKLLAKCLDSIKKYPPKGSYQVIVIDNNKDNVGFSKAVNKGIRKSKGKYKLILNPDCEVKEKNIESLISFADSHSDAGAIVPRLLNTDGSLQPSIYNFPTVWRAIKQYWFGEENILDKYAPKKEQPIEAAVMACFLVAPLAIKKIGLLDEKYFLYFEDIDYCQRLNKAGLKIYYLPSVEVIHTHGASGGTNKELVESSKKYFGFLRYYLYTFILWSGQKWQKFMH